MDKEYFIDSDSWVLSCDTNVKWYDEKDLEVQPIFNNEKYDEFISKRISQIIHATRRRNIHIVFVAPSRQH